MSTTELHTHLLDLHKEITTHRDHGTVTIALAKAWLFKLKQWQAAMDDKEKRACQPHKDAIKAIKNENEFERGLIEANIEYTDTYLDEHEPKVKQQISAEQQAEYVRFGEESAQAALEGRPIDQVVPPRFIPDLPKTQEGITTAMITTWRIPGYVEDGKPCEGIMELSGLCYESLELHRIPNEYFILDLAKIGKAVRAGVKVPGIEIYQKPNRRRQKI